MADWLSALFDEPPEEKTEAIVKEEPPGGMVLVEQTVDRLFEGSAQIVGAALRFADIEPDQEEPPEDWVKELGPEGAARALRIAKLANLPHKDVPAGLDIAHKVFTGITKAKLDKQGDNRPIHIAFVQYEQTEVKFGEVIVEEEDGKRRKKPRNG